MLELKVKHCSMVDPSARHENQAMLAKMKMVGKLRAAMKAAGVKNVALAAACGVTEQAVSQWFSTGRVSKENLLIAAKLCHVTVDDLLVDESSMRVSEHGAAYDAPARERTIPIISTIQAGAFWPADDPYPVGFGDGDIPVLALPLPVGPAAFGLRVKGDSMREEYHAGDIVVIDPMAPPRPGDHVVAKRDEDDEATFKVYRPRGADDQGKPIIELVPINEHFPTLIINATHPGRIVGPMVARIQGRRNGGTPGLR